MQRANRLQSRACPSHPSPQAWETQRVDGKARRVTIPVGSRHVVDYKALSRTTSTRKRVRNARTPATHPAPPAAEPLGRLLARELHDSVAQTLSAMLLELENFRLEQYGRAGVLRQVDLLEQSTRKALEDLRALLVELRSQQSSEEDLVRLLKHGMLERQGRGRQVEFGLNVAPDWPERMPAVAAMELYHIVAEAIDNGIRHAAPRRIEVSLGLGLGGQLAVLTINDDGRGLPKHEDLSARKGLGILGMRERAALLGGEVRLEDGPDGRGTSVQVTVPIAAVIRSLPSP
jgi:two-component system sensor histidine kinase UhpB